MRTAAEILGLAVAFGLPLVSLIVFALAALAGLTIGTGVLPDLQVWAYVTLALAVLSFFAWRKDRRAACAVTSEALR